MILFSLVPEFYKAPSDIQSISDRSHFNGNVSVCPGLNNFIRTFKQCFMFKVFFFPHHDPIYHPLWRLDSCVTAVMERLEIVANPSKKERMTSWTGRQFLQNPVSSLSPGFRVRILRPYEKENPTISTHHTTNTTITQHIQP